MEKFESTTEGYNQAKQWLQSIGKWDEVSTTGFSVDGYSIVNTANVLWKQMGHAPSIYISDEAGQFPGHSGTPIMVPINKNFFKGKSEGYTAGTDPITSNKPSKGVWTKIPITYGN